MSCHICGSLEATRGEVAQTACRIAKNLGAILHATEHVDEGVRQHVGQMAGGGENLVVVVDIHFQHVRPDRLPHRQYPFDRVRVRLRYWGDDDSPAFEQSLDRRVDATVLRPCDGMRGHEPRQPGAEHGSSRRHDTALCAADIGDDRVIADSVANAFEYRADSAERNRHDDHVRAGHRARGIDVESVDHTEGDGTLEIRRATARTHDLSDFSEPSQVAGKRTPDKARADDA